MPDPEVHTTMCEQVHDLLIKASQDLEQSRPKSLSRALLRALIAALAEAEHAAHAMCPEPDKREVAPS